MNRLESVLKKLGPSASSRIVEELVTTFRISKSTARKSVSRGTANTSSLKGISLPRGEKFVYLKKDYGSPYYWERLVSTLQTTNSAYGLALGALVQRGEIVLRKHFSIICGAPLRQSKHLSPETILNNLLLAQLVKIVDVAGLGECVVLAKGDPHYYQELVPNFKAKMQAENILLAGVSSWIKNIGLCSYDKVETRNDENTEQPKVGTFHWDLTAPSYVGPLLTQPNKDGPNKPGFVACDVSLGSRMTLAGITPFLNKCKTLRSLKNVGKCIQIFVADRFEKDAFNAAKQVGVLPVTTETMFGNDVAEGLKYLLAALTGLANLMFEPDMFDEMFRRLSRVEGALSNLRGTFFEFIVAEACRKKYNEVRMNCILQTPNGDLSESDVVTYHLGELKFIECKGYSPHAVLPDSEVEKWLTQRVPRTFKAAKNHPDWKNLVPTFEFWTTGKLSDRAIQMLSEAKNGINPRRYKIAFKDIGQVANEIRESRDTALAKSFEKNFMKNPLSEIKLKKPKFGSLTQPAV